LTDINFVFDSRIMDEFVNLKAVSIGSCTHIYINNETILFENLRNLEQIDLSNLNIDSYFLEDRIMFSKFKNLEWVDLSCNKIESLPEYLFSMNSYLTFLNLSNNYLKTFDASSVLSPIVTLTNLDLSFNSFDYLQIKSNIFS